MKVNGVNLDEVPIKQITPLQLKCLIAEAEVKARDFAIAPVKMLPYRR